MRRRLEVPHHLAGVRIDGHDGTGVKVIALATALGHHRIRIAGADNIEVQFGVISAGDPGLARAVGGRILIGPGLNAGLAFARRGPPFPLQFAVLGVEGLHKARIIQMVAADAGNDVIADDHGRDGRSVVELRVGQANLPTLLARSRVETHQVTVGRLKEQPVAVHTHAAVADGAARVGWILIVPQLAAGAGIGGPNMIGRGEVENAVHHQRRRLDRDARPIAEARGPGERQGVYVGGIDLR